MKVRCLFNTIHSIPNSQTQRRLEKYIHSSEGRVGGLVPGTVYQVYGLVFRDEVPWYYLCEDRDDEYPIPSPSALFETVDGRMSKYWRNQIRTGQKFVVFDSWSYDRMFYENLLNGGKSEIETFARYRKLMDLEFEENRILRLGVQAGVFVLIKENDNSSYADDLAELFGDIKNGWGFSRALWSYQPSPSEFVKLIQILGIILFFHRTFDPNVYLFEDTADLALLLENGFPEMSFFLTNESRDFVIYFDFENKFFFAKGNVSASLFSGET